VLVDELGHGVGESAGSSGRGATAFDRRRQSV